MTCGSLRFQVQIPEVFCSHSDVHFGPLVFAVRLGISSRQKIALAKLSTLRATLPLFEAEQSPKGK
jgi:hypothetical protein